MGDGIEANVKLTIGFLNHDKELLLAQYIDIFDIVVLNDAPMDLINNLLSVISDLGRK